MKFLRTIALLLCAGFSWETGGCTATGEACDYGQQLQFGYGVQQFAAPVQYVQQVQQYVQPVQQFAYPQQFVQPVQQFVQPQYAQQVVVRQRRAFVGYGAQAVIVRPRRPLLQRIFGR